MNLGSLGLLIENYNVDISLDHELGMVNQTCYFLGKEAGVLSNRYSKTIVATKEEIERLCELYPEDFLKI